MGLALEYNGLVVTNGYSQRTTRLPSSWAPRAVGVRSWPRWRQGATFRWSHVVFLGMFNDFLWFFHGFFNGCLCCSMFFWWVWDVLTSHEGFSTMVWWSFEDLSMAVWCTPSSLVRLFRCWISSGSIVFVAHEGLMVGRCVEWGLMDFIKKFLMWHMVAYARLWSRYRRPDDLQQRQ